MRGRGNVITAGPGGGETFVIMLPRHLNSSWLGEKFSGESSRASPRGEILFAMLLARAMGLEEIFKMMFLRIFFSVSSLCAWYSCIGCSKKTETILVVAVL